MIRFKHSIRWEQEYVANKERKKEMVTRTGTTYDSELKIWNGPDRDFDSNVALGTYIFNYLKSETAVHPNKVIQVRKLNIYFTIIAGN